MASPTAISPQTSSTSPTSTAEYPDYITPWDENLEARLQYNKKELGASQKRWSESQELWLDEVDRLNAMKKKHLKDMKKWRAQQAEQKEAEKAKKWFGLWKNKTLKPSKEPVSTRPASPYPAENPRRMSLSNAFRRMSSMSVKKE